MKFEQIEAYTNVGSIPIFLEVGNGGAINDNWFYGLDLESGGETGGTQIKFITTDNTGGIVGNYFKGSMWTHTGTTSILLSDADGTGFLTAFTNTFDFNVYLDDNGATTHVLNESHAGGGDNEYNLRISLGSGTTLTADQFLATWDLPHITWTLTIPGGYIFKNPKASATTNCVNGTFIQHSVGITPQWVLATGSIMQQIVSVTAINSTHFQLGIWWSNGTEVDATHSPCTVYWKAGWNN